MSQMKLQSLIFLCPVCNITKYVNIQKYINNILNVNKHKLTCPLCINNYTGINNLIIHIITDHKTLLSVNDGNVSVNLNNFAGNHIITNVETICGDLKIRETREKVHPVQLENSLKNIPYAEDLGDPDPNSHSCEVINSAGNELIILQSIPSDSYVTQVTTLAEDYTKPKQDEIISHHSQVEQHIDSITIHNEQVDADFMAVQPDNKVPDEMCFMENSFCDKFYDCNKLKDNAEIDGLKFDIDQFLNEMSNANALGNDTIDSTHSDIHNQACLDTNQPVNGQTVTLSPSHVPMDNISGVKVDRNHFIWDEINSMNQTFNVNQIHALETNTILQRSPRENQVGKLENVFRESSNENPMLEDVVAVSEDSLLNGNIQTRDDMMGKTNQQAKSFQNAFYENLLQRDVIGSKRLKSNVEETKPNRLRLFRDKPRSKTQRLEKLQFLTMNKKFEEHLSLDEVVPVTSSTCEIASIAMVNLESEPTSNKRQNETSLESSSKYPRTVDYETTLDEVILFKCDPCNFYFQNADILTMHNQLLHNGTTAEKGKAESYKCNYCSRVFNMKGSLMIHLKVAHLGLSNSSSSKSSPKSDVASDVTTLQTFTCSLCSKSFKKEPHLLQHLKTHEGKQWECKLCSKLFTTKYFLKKHNRLHTGEMPYKCHLCEKSFTFQQSYHKHLLYHSDDKPHVCSQCGRAFKELSTLHNHERIHSGEKPFCCETCGKSFRQRVSYLVHQRIHTGVTPYKCSACHKTFRYKISDKMHKCSFGLQGRIVKAQSPLIEKLLAKSRAAKTEDKS